MRSGVNQSSAHGLTEQVKAASQVAGFDAVGICDLRPIERDALQRWLAAGYAASMRYLHRQATKRQEPAMIAPGCHRAVVVLKNYYQRSEARSEAAGGISRYAWGEDYHHVMGDQLAGLAEALIELGSKRECTRCYADAGPVPERELAQRAGLGWIARNTMLVHPRLGSFTFIGTVFTDLELAVDAPFTSDHCGTCQRCTEVCPTQAFPEPHMIDARRCISYLTIEHRGDFDHTQGPRIGQWLFGCDLCQDVCPWNLKFAPESAELRFAPRPELTQPDLATLADIAPPIFKQLYGDTALVRAGTSGIARNARQVLRNTGKS